MVETKPKSLEKIRMFDLSPYPKLEDQNIKKCHPDKSNDGGLIQCSIREVRLQVTKGYQMVTKEKERVVDVFETGKEHTKFIFHYLNEPSNTLPRAGAIALGGVSGFIIGLRHGSFRRLLYTGIGAASIASICYPKDAEIIAQKSLAEAKVWAKIGYNFAYGVKPGSETNLPEFPTLSGVYDTVNGMVSSLTSVFKSESGKNK